MELLVAGRPYRLAGPETTLGSGQETAVHVEGAEIEPVHAIVRCDPDGRVSVHPAGPETLVSVNGVAVGPSGASLVAGDCLALASVEIRVRGDQEGGSVSDPTPAPGAVQRLNVTLAGFPAYAPPPHVERAGPDPSLANLVAVIRSGVRRGDVVPLPSGGDVGRDSVASLYLPDPSVSQHHARIEWEHGSWKLADLGSTNGTSVRGSRLSADERRSIVSGATVLFGRVEVGFAFGPSVTEDQRALSAGEPASRLPLVLSLLLLLALAAAAILIF